MNLNRFFDGGYVDEDGQLVLKITTLHNPAGFVIKAERTGSSLTIDIDKAMDLFERLGLLEKRDHITPSAGLWTPLLLCPECIALLESELAACQLALAKVGPYYIPATCVGDDEAKAVYAAIDKARKGEGG